MPHRNRFSDMLNELTALRHDLHQHPELMFDTHRTSGIVADLLRAYGCDEVTEGIGRTGVVGTIKGRKDSKGRVVGLRADMDALPIQEATGLPYASKTAGKMHACGHDGHTVMLLGAAKYLCETRSFDGTVVVIFQPAEEGGGGGREMCADGLMTRWNIQEVYGMHNWPGVKTGSFHIRAGAFFASTDTLDITITGRGGHAAKPNKTIDPTLIASHIVIALQSVVSRNVDPVENCVVSITSFETDTKTTNVIPQRVYLKGTVRALNTQVQQLAKERILGIIKATADAFGAKAQIEYQEGYPVMVNDETMTQHARAAAQRVAGTCFDSPQVMGAEDFAFMANERPAAYILLGNGDGAAVHHPEYNFNDDAIPAGCSWWVEIAENRLALPDNT